MDGSTGSHETPASVSHSKTGVFIRSFEPRDTPILPQKPSSNCDEKRYKLLDFNDIWMSI